jgi:hypothetical protein
MKVLDVQSELDEIDHARRHVGQSIAASGITMRRVLRRRDEEAPQIGDTPGHSERLDSWPRGISAPARRDPRFAVAGVLLVFVLLGAVTIKYERRAVQTSRAPVSVKAIAPIPKSVSIPVPAAGEPFVIRVAATRPCLVRIVVDGTTLDWRAMKEGDEFVSRPEREIFIESSDAGALAATVNGKSTRLGVDGQAAVFHLAR